MLSINSSSAFFGGVATGLDTNSLIEALTTAQRLPLLRLEERQQRLQAARSLFLDLDSKLDTLRSAASSIDTLSEVGAFSATSSDEDILRVTANGAASVGSYSVRVNSLATARTSQSTAENARTNTVGSGTIEITVAGVATNVAIGAGDDLDAIASAINAADAGVRASVVQETSTSFRLLVQSEETGVDNEFSLDDSGFTASGLFEFVSGADLVASADASIEFNNITLSRASNSISDVVEGLTFDLQSAAPGTLLTVGVTVDSSAVQSKIQSFLDAYNDVIGTVGASRNSRDPDLSNASTLRLVETTLRSALQTETSGTGSVYSTLAALGIRSSSNGQLTLDEETFDDAIAADATGVLDLFIDASTGVATNFKSAVDRLNEPGSGLLTSRASSLDSRIRNLQNSISSLEEKLARNEERLVQQFSLLEQLTSGLQGQLGALQAIPRGLGR